MDDLLFSIFLLINLSRLVRRSVESNMAAMVAILKMFLSLLILYRNSLIFIMHM